MLFRISDSNVFVIASIHRRPNGAPLDGRYSLTISEAEECYFEHAPSGNAFAEAGKCRGCKWLGSYIPLRLCAQTLDLYRRLGVRELPLRRKPWWVAMQLHGTLNERAGNAGKNSIDSYLWAFAEKKGKPVLTLDAPNIYEMFESMPMAEHTSQLEEIVSDPNGCIEKSIQGFEKWSKGDLGAFATDFGKWLKEKPVMATKMITDRNQLWMPAIVRAVQLDKRAVFTVGTNHLVGQRGLKELIKKELPGRDLIEK